jgi:hypothetical protein
MVARYKKGERALVLEISDNGREFALQSMVKDGEAIFDKLKNKEYAITCESSTLFIPKKLMRGSYHVHLLDKSAGATVQLVRDDKLFKIKTNANLIGTVMSSRLLQQTFSLKPDNTQLLIIGAVCLIMGALIGKAI